MLALSYALSRKAVPYNYQILKEDYFLLSVAHEKSTYFSVTLFLNDYMLCKALLCRTQINWRAVGWGLGIQFVLALLILRWDVGYDVFDWIGDRVTTFLSFSDAGAEFIFGEVFREHFFAFSVSKHHVCKHEANMNLECCANTCLLQNCIRTYV